MAEYINGNVKEIEGKFGKFLSCSIKLEELQKIVNDKGYCNFNLNPRKEIGKYGETHSITKNDWKPEETREEYHKRTREECKEGDKKYEEFKTGSYGNARSKEIEVDLESIPF